MDNDGLFDEEGWDNAPAADIDNTPMVKAKLAWDMIPHENVADMFPELGLLPSSDEGMAMEHTECHRRMNATTPLFPLIGAYATLITDIVGTVLIRVDLDEIQDPEDREMLAQAKEAFCNQNFILIRAAATSIIANFLDMGLLKLGDG